MPIQSFLNFCNLHAGLVYDASINLMDQVHRFTNILLYIAAGADPGFWERGGLINIFTTGGGYRRGSDSDINTYTCT